MSVLPLFLIALAHCVVDTVALFIQPLWPSLQSDLSLSNGAIQWAFVLWNITTSISQLGFGYLGDRYHGTWMIWFGPLVAVLCLSCLGFVDSLPGLCLLLLIGGLGVGAFHPEAAAMVGHVAPENRSRAMSVFVIGGTIGQALGPVYSGSLTSLFGLRSLVWSLTWGLLLVFFVAAGLHRAPQMRFSLPPSKTSFGQVLSGRRRHVALVLAIGTLRVLPVLGVLQGLAFMIHARGGSNADIGLAQSVFQFATGAGVLGCALCVGPARERLTLWLLPLFSAPALLFCPLASFPVLLVCLSVAGIVLGGATPLLISYGQALLPNGQRVASSITMGVSWGLGGAIVALAMAIFDRMNQPELAFYTFAVAPFFSSVLCAWLPVLGPHAPRGRSSFSEHTGDLNPARRGA